MNKIQSPTKSKNDSFGTSRFSRISVRPKPKLRPKLRWISAEIVRPKLRWSWPNHRTSKKRHFWQFLAIFQIFSISLSISNFWISITWLCKSHFNYFYNFKLIFKTVHFGYMEKKVAYREESHVFDGFYGYRFGRSFGRSFGGDGRSFGVRPNSILGGSVVH